MKVRDVIKMLKADGRSNDSWRRPSRCTSRVFARTASQCPNPRVLHVTSLSDPFGPRSARRPPAQKSSNTVLLGAPFRTGLSLSLISVTRRALGESGAESPLNRNRPAVSSWRDRSLERT